MTATQSPADSVGVTDIAGHHTDDAGVRRDRHDRYLVVPPSGGKLRPYRRVSTVYKALDSGGGLTPWAQGRAVLGMIRDPDTLRQLRSLVRKYPDPWYATPEAKARMKELIQRAAVAGGTDKASDRGTWLHSVAQRQFQEREQLPEFSADDRAWLDQLLDALQQRGIVVDPDWVERIVVHDRYGIAGKPDYLRVIVPGYRHPLVADLKTGDSLTYSLRGYLTQLAVYVTADHVYTQGPAEDGSEDSRSPMPMRDQESALIIHAPQSGAPVQFHVVDVAAGVRAFELALAVEGYRSGDIEAVPLSIWQPAAPPTPPAETANRLHAVPPVATEAVVLEVAEAAEPAVPEVVDVRGSLQARIDALGRSPHGRSMLLVLWPKDMPSLRASDEHTPEQLAVIGGVLDHAEHDLAVATVTAAFPGSTVLTGATTREGHRSE